MKINNSVTKLLNIEHPIISAPMGIIAGSMLANEVTQAGGLGMIGGGYCNKKSIGRKRRYLGRYFAHPMMQNRRAKRDDYKPSAVRVTQRYVP
ncbi:putative enoyl-[acyl-carrier-protein] reductase II [Piscirickettsia salmonis]|uniref:Pentapeptide repeats family protein n=2 Tax=Piscirickettsia salmonis TaxID=1238 RepID=A0AAC8VIA4_PISSA|nr:nitronate monooxygenase [Piscirickettsia salmonis]ALB22916.1 pentapeptide repeats family protein [Piscirickettsia salmonis]QGN98481.1 putative enoyl-[acyl-carrier-protein] reductase II [Piscirickettsia salmonis]QGO02101.1 putative enoyl-[acyl-carrier-protein] reductase II [Piscirickettsia salmonis]QGO12789.1 putative enoyl-[acyl-carrier-protein] reductase II [Piscirickettsia salmonis]QGO19831.1 putative enoyl-[acyl-carrier-protein] reductase II [Piscirickettsia salmonis]